MGRPFLIYGPSQLGLIFNINVSIIVQQGWGHGLRHDFPSPGAAREDLDVHLLAVWSPVSPYMFKVRGGSSFPSVYICIRGVCLLTALAFSFILGPGSCPDFPRRLAARCPFSLGALLAEDRPYLLRTVVMVPPPH